MTFAGLMHTGEDRIRDVNRGLTSNPSARDSVPSAHAAVGVCRRLQRPDDGRPDGDEAPAFRFYIIDY